MKKIIFILAAFVMTAATLQAQSQKFEFGIDPGVSIAKASFSPTGDVKLKSLVGFDGGVFATYKVSPMFALQLEANYSMGGLKATSSSGNTTINLDYITVPLLAKVMPTEGFAIFVGPQIGFLTTANAKTEGETQDLSPALKSTDVFAVFGAEYHLPMGVFFGARYNLGLANIVSEDLDATIKNRNFAIRIGYVFKSHAPVKKK